MISVFLKVLLLLNVVLSLLCHLLLRSFCLLQLLILRRTVVFVCWANRRTLVSFTWRSSKALPISLRRLWRSTWRPLITRSWRASDLTRRSSARPLRRIGSTCSPPENPSTQKGPFHCYLLFPVRSSFLLVAASESQRTLLKDDFYYYYLKPRFLSLGSNTNMLWFCYYCYLPQGKNGFFRVLNII